MKYEWYSRVAALLEKVIAMNRATLEREEDCEKNK
jgi:hypothetical protein